MSVIVSCQCGQQFATQERHIGKRVPCPVCGRMLTIGETAPSPPPPLAPPATTTIRAACACGRAFVVPVSMQGMTMTCPGCHDMIVVPPADPDASQPLPADPLGLPADPLSLTPASDDSTEKLAYRVAYIAAGSVGLLAVAIILTSLFQSIVRVWTAPPVVADAPPQSAEPTSADAKSGFPSLPAFIPPDYSPFSRTSPRRHRRLYPRCP